MGRRCLHFGQCFSGVATMGNLVSGLGDSPGSPIFRGDWNDYTVSRIDLAWARPRTRPGSELPGARSVADLDGIDLGHPVFNESCDS
jgi:hypothetical protein